MFRIKLMDRKTLLTLFAAGGILAANFAFYTTYKPEWFKLEISDETRAALGCIDNATANLVESFRDASQIKYDTGTEIPGKLGWLRMINDQASIHLQEAGDCHDILAEVDPDFDKGEEIASHIAILADLYEPIFMGEAVNLSKMMREMLGIGTEKVTPSSVRLPTIDSGKSLETAEATFQELSTYIATKVSAH